jgi:excisionase family DNA binding protein
MSPTDLRQRPGDKRLSDPSHENGVVSIAGARNDAGSASMPSADLIPRLLTVEEVAQVLRCSRSTVYSLISSAKIVGLRIGSHSGGIRICAEDLQAYLDTCRVEPASHRCTVKLPKLKHLRI